MRGGDALAGGGRLRGLMGVRLRRISRSGVCQRHHQPYYQRHRRADYRVHAYSTVSLHSLYHTRRIRAMVIRARFDLTNRQYAGYIKIIHTVGASARREGRSKHG